MALAGFTLRLTCSKASALTMAWSCSGYTTHSVWKISLISHLSWFHPIPLLSILPPPLTSSLMCPVLSFPKNVHLASPLRCLLDLKFNVKIWTFDFPSKLFLLQLFTASFCHCPGHNVDTHPSLLFPYPKSNLFSPHSSFFLPHGLPCNSGNFLSMSLPQGICLAVPVAQLALPSSVHMQSPCLPFGSLFKCHMILKVFPTCLGWENFLSAKGHLDI